MGKAGTEHRGRHHQLIIITKQLDTQAILATNPTSPNQVVLVVAMGDPPNHGRLPGRHLSLKQHITLVCCCSCCFFFYAFCVCVYEEQGLFLEDSTRTFNLFMKFFPFLNDLCMSFVLAFVEPVVLPSSDKIGQTSKGGIK